MRKIVYAFLPFLLLFSDCLYSQKNLNIDLARALEHPTEIALSDFVDSIKYIPLATTYDCLVDKNPRVHVTQNYILIVNTNRCLLFSRKNGEFIREINHYGRGPEEYQSVRGFFNEHNSMYYFQGWNGDLIKYSIDDIYTGKIKIPGYKNTFDSPAFPMNYSFINESLIICDFLIATGVEPNSLMIFNENNEILKIFPNSNVLKARQKYTMRTGESSYYHYNNSLLFQNIYNDTIFNISLDGKSPHLILKAGKYRPPFEAKWWSNDKWIQNGFIRQPAFFENRRFISFNFYSGKNKYFALYDKLLKSIRVAENNSGIINDLDGLIDITFDSMNLAGELIGIISANDFVKYKETDHDKIKLTKSELNRLDIIEMEDNPIIVIAKFK